ncbi:hypothetical protein L6452_27527 [Arctium lappa]|uniref:Uncharacterized protein n=1 Tax=Arctium lappa TaxID=4217 RepID=A0ACB8ZWG0_ARCLA|nr:hypothetical protein L6452_27527 [Arctium lappa]
MEGVDYLSDERKKAQFDVDDVKVAWAGSREALEVSDRIAKLRSPGGAIMGGDSVMNPELIINHKFPEHYKETTQLSRKF